MILSDGTQCESDMDFNAQQPTKIYWKQVKSL